MVSSLGSRHIYLVGVAVGAICLSMCTERAAAAPATNAEKHPVRMIKAGDVFALRNFQGLSRREDLERTIADYTRDVAYNIKVNKGDTSRISWSTLENNVVVSDYITLKPEDMAVYRKQLDALTFPEPPRAEYRIRFIALTDFSPGQPLPTRLEVVQDKWIADKGIFLASVRMDEKAMDKSLPDEKLGFSALKILADSVRAKLRALGVPEPFASERVGMSVPELEGLGAAMRLGKPANVELAAIADTPVWTHDYTGVKVTWKASGAAPAKSQK